jgi:hypothetical protein
MKEPSSIAVIERVAFIHPLPEPPQIYDPQPTVGGVMALSTNLTQHVVRSYEDITQGIGTNRKAEFANFQKNFRYARVEEGETRDNYFADNASYKRFLKGKRSKKLAPAEVDPETKTIFDWYVATELVLAGAAGVKLKAIKPNGF